MRKIKQKKIKQKLSENNGRVRKIKVSRIHEIYLESEREFSFSEINWMGFCLRAFMRMQGLVSFR